MFYIINSIDNFLYTSICLLSFPNLRKPVWSFTIINIKKTIKTFFYIFGWRLFEGYFVLLLFWEPQLLLVVFKIFSSSRSSRSIVRWHLVSRDGRRDGSKTVDWVSTVYRRPNAATFITYKGVMNVTKYRYFLDSKGETESPRNSLRRLWWSKSVHQCKVLGGFRYSSCFSRFENNKCSFTNYLTIIIL